MDDYFSLPNTSATAAHAAGSLYTPISPSCAPSHSLAVTPAAVVVTSTSNISSQHSDAVNDGEEVVHSALKRPGKRSANATADKSCKACRTRKVKCDRSWPRCGRCSERKLDCHFGSLDDFLKNMTTHEDARVSQLEARISSLELELSTQNLFLPAASELPSSIANAFLAGVQDHEEAVRHMARREQEQGQMAIARRKLIESGVAVPDDRSSYVGELSLSARLAKPALQNSFCLHLLDAFFAACCSSLPVFRSWHGRLAEMIQDVDALDSPSRVAVAAFCSIGARTTPHSALLGIPDLTSTSPNDSHALALAGIRREQACRALNAEAVDLYEKLEVAHDLSTKCLESSMAVMQMHIFSELIPRRSRSMVRTAFGQFKDLQDAAAAEAEVEDLVKRLGLPLLHGDAVTSAYARRAPLISDADVAAHFNGLSLPNIASDSLAAGIAKFIRSGEESNHLQLSAASMVILRWLVTVQREFAKLSCPRASQQKLSPDRLVDLWSALDQIHGTIQNLQHMLCHLDRLPPGCEVDGCQHLHLRFITRMGREVDNVTWLVHSLIQERMDGTHGARDGIGAEWLEESERRVRKGLKLAAFYFEMYSVSMDPHQNFYLAWQLELMPNWTTLAVQRFGEMPGPPAADVELTETELDWIEKGLEIACFYHPVAERRLQEIRTMRRLPRPDSLPSRATPDRPRLAFPEAMMRTTRSAVPSWG